MGLQFAPGIKGADITRAALIARLENKAFSPSGPQDRSAQKDAIKLLDTVEKSPATTLGGIHRSLYRKALGITAAGVGSVLSISMLGACTMTGSSLAAMSGASGVGTAITACFGFVGAAILGFAAASIAQSKQQDIMAQRASLARLGEEMTAQKPMLLLTYNPGQPAPCDITCTPGTCQPTAVAVNAPASSS